MVLHNEMQVELSARLLPQAGVFPYAALICLLLGMAAGSARAAGTKRAVEPSSAPRGVGADPAFRVAAAAAKRDLRASHPAGEAGRIERGVDQVLRYWRAEDGDAESLGAFLRSEFLPRGETLDATFRRLEFALERIDGYMLSLVRDLRRGVDLDIGPMLPIDRRLADYEPTAHLSDDLFRGKLAFVVLLNFPLTTLEERLKEGRGWTRRRWAEVRLAQRFSTRVPGEVNRRINAAYVAADAYINDYNIYMHHLLTGKGERLFPEGLRLISHWGLRDELKARYADPQGLPKQRMIRTVMERIVRQEIPEAVIDNPLLDWTPSTNAVAVSPVEDAAPPAGATAEARSEREPDTRYERWLAVFRAVRLADPYHPDEPTLIDRRFNVHREIPETEVRALLESILRSPLSARVARLIEKRLGRDLEPFDIWYVGFRPRGRYEEAELDRRTRGRYPSAEAFARDIPRILRSLGFSGKQARFLARRIVVDPSRGAGHALGAARRDDSAHLRTRVGGTGMDYKGYNIAVHELGHNVEQIFSLNRIDHTLLSGVPNTAFTEALAFVFQGRDLELLGLVGEDPGAERLRALETFWATREIAGVALVDMAAWRWLYDHPEATPEEFREAVVGIAGDVWNRHFADLLGGRDVPLLAVYSHMVSYGLYTPDYPLGHLIAFQVERHLRRDRDMGPEFERLCRIGSLTPDAWMRQAVGAPISAEPLLKAAAEALDALEAYGRASR
ncbi:MAG: hypothetical protein ACE5JH_04370 [Acidobacteriota bacterium]